MPRVRFDLLFILLVLIVHIAVFTAPVNALLDRWFTTDDAFYYFQVARNISEGYGSTFDRIHPANGYHPLWMLLMIPVFSLARLDEFFPLRVVVLISVMLSAGSGLLLYRLLARLIARHAAYAGLHQLHHRVALQLLGACNRGGHCGASRSCRPRSARTGSSTCRHPAQPNPAPAQQQHSQHQRQQPQVQDEVQHLRTVAGALPPPQNAHPGQAADGHQKGQGPEKRAQLKGFLSPRLASRR